MILGTLMVPDHVTLVPRYIVTRNLGLIDSLWAVLLPATAQVFGIFLMRQYIQTLPSELEDAARIDGCGEFGVFWRVIMPLSAPAVGALAIFIFVRNWNDFFWPLIVLQKSPNYTLPVGVASLQGEFSTDYGIIFAGAALAALAHHDLLPAVPALLPRRRAHGRAEGLTDHRPQTTDYNQQPLLLSVVWRSVVSRQKEEEKHTAHEPAFGEICL